MTDIFDFWAPVGRADRVHPDDKKVLERVKHDFDLTCLPACCGGPLLTAKVVLLYLSPGLGTTRRNAAAPIMTEVMAGLSVRGRAA
jgi:hypothetical protein